MGSNSNHHKKYEAYKCDEGFSTLKLLNKRLSTKGNVTCHEKSKQGY